MEEPIDESTSSFRESTARLARMLLVSLFYASVGEHGKESHKNFTNCYFIASASTIGGHAALFQINFMP